MSVARAGETTVDFSDRRHRMSVDGTGSSRCFHLGCGGREADRPERPATGLGSGLAGVEVEGGDVAYPSLTPGVQTGKACPADPGGPVQSADGSDRVGEQPSRGYGACFLECAAVQQGRRRWWDHPDSQVDRVVDTVGTDEDHGVSGKSAARQIGQLAVDDPGEQVVSAEGCAGPATRARIRAMTCSGIGLMVTPTPTM